MTITGVYAQVRGPLKDGGVQQNDIGSFESYSHEIAAMGGFLSASITIRTTQIVAEDWLESGLLRDITVLDQFGRTAFNGFVNRVSVVTGALSEDSGSVMDVDNRIFATFTPRDFTVRPPADGAQTVTTIVQSTASQAVFGIAEEVVSAGTCEPLTAELIRDRELNARQWPNPNGTLNISPTSEQSPAVMLEILGYIHLLHKYLYIDTNNTTVYVSDKIVDVLQATVNAWVVSNDFTHIAENLYLVNTLEDQYRKAWDVIMEMMAFGNVDDTTRSTFGFYEDRVAYYSYVSSTTVYYYRLSDLYQQISTADGTIVHPWMVRPGVYVEITDIMVGRLTLANRPNPRKKFIESVRYTAPDTVELIGGNNNTLPSVIAKITYTGGIY